MSKPVSAAKARDAMVRRRLGPKAAKQDRTRIDEQARFEKEKASPPARPSRPEKPWVDPYSIPTVEQTWHAVIIAESGAEPYCDGICMKVDGRPSPVHRVVETDSGCYPPSVEQAHLIAKAPELYRELAANLRLFKSLGAPAGVVAKLERLLAKARGESP